MVKMPDPCYCRQQDDNKQLLAKLHRLPAPLPRLLAGGLTNNDQRLRQSTSVTSALFSVTLHLPRRPPTSDLQKTTKQLFLPLLHLQLQELRLFLQLPLDKNLIYNLNISYSRRRPCWTRQRTTTDGASTTTTTSSISRTTITKSSSRRHPRWSDDYHAGRLCSFPPPLNPFPTLAPHSQDFGLIYNQNEIMVL